MARQVLYVQCILRNGKSLQTSWIPEKYAIVGQYLKLFDNDVWQNGWQVISNGVKVSKSSVDILSSDYKRTRRATDL